MKVALFGITDRLLEVFEEEASLKDCYLQAYKGSAQDKIMIEKFVRGFDLIVSGGSNDIDFVSAIISAAEKSNVKRFIQISGTEVKNENDSFAMPFFVLNFCRRMNKKTYEQRIAVSKAVEASKLDWTLVRCPIVDKSPKNISIRVGYVNSYMKLKLSQGNMAGFILREGQENLFIKKSICISK